MKNSYTNYGEAWKQKTGEFDYAFKKSLTNEKH